MGALENRKLAFIQLGDYLSNEAATDEELNEAIAKSIAINHWFTQENIHHALLSLGKLLSANKISKWIAPYEKIFEKNPQPKLVGVIMAGNIPLVGFHDFLCVLLSGHKLMAKLSSDDKLLLPVLAKKLISFYPKFSEYIFLTEERIKKPEAMIATGSNNSARYFHYYFGKYPNIIRKNRNGIAVLSGRETEQELKYLGEDIFRYYGLGCRNVSKLYVPENYNFDKLFEALESYSSIAMHNKYNNNYEYYRSIYLINKVLHLDNGFIMITQEKAIASPLSVIYYEEYKNLDILLEEINNRNDEIQCVVSSLDLEGQINFGQAQTPELNDYADGINTLDFLAKLI